MRFLWNSILFIFLILLILPIHAQEVFVEEGYASYYDDSFQGKATANHELFDQTELTAAHPTLPFDARVKVTNLVNNKSVTVRINDRGPFVEGRIIDLTRAAAKKLNMLGSGTVKVKIELLSITPEPAQIKIVERGFFKRPSSGRYKTGYGVQIGSFVDLENITKITKDLKAAYHRKIIVEITTVSNQKVYKIIVGHYPDKIRAARLLKKVRQRFPKSFVINFKEL